jgi:hypothetical protein
VAIYLDTNVFQDGLTGLRATSARVVARAHGLDIAVPQLVVKEAHANRRRLIEQRMADLEKALVIGSGLFAVPRFIRPDAARLAAEWAHDISKMVRVIPARDQHAVEALHREIERLPPAGEAGARDAAIWLAISEDHRLRDEVGYLLSADKGFRDPEVKEPRLLPALADELGTAKPMYLAPAIEHLLGLLATEGGREFALDEIRANRGLPSLVSVAVKITGRLDTTADEVLASSLGLNLAFAPGLVAVAQEVSPASIAAIEQQKVYQLGEGREVAVIDSTWSMQLTVRITSGAKGFNAGRWSLGPSATVTLPPRAVEARIQLWAQRESARPATFEIGNLDAVRVSVIG